MKVNPHEARFTCNRCQSPNVEFLYPAWVPANSPAEQAQVDWEAEVLTTWCYECEDETPIWDSANERSINGRW